MHAAATSHVQRGDATAAPAIATRARRRCVGVHEHPEEVLEQHHLAANHCAGAAAAVTVCVTLGDDLEERVVDHVGANEVPPSRLADVDQVEPVTLLVAAVHGGHQARGVARGASGGETVMRGVRPVLEHVLELP
ncbi:hypothetical protein MUK42_33595 [Musa troglodytarum]|uniref:Uncharacterized protein n=1 Tax=Musa troglodytarum TaxID=320322 RepID=A0A9E7LD91_9LILI|nr:hypothetical protein MUK42_33595 [Musa troglodytarum]